MTEKCKHEGKPEHSWGQMFCRHCGKELELVEKGKARSVVDNLCAKLRVTHEGENVTLTLKHLTLEEVTKIEDTVRAAVEIAGLKERLAAEEERNNMLARINEEVNSEVENLQASEDRLAAEIVAAESNACPGEEKCEALCEAREILSRIRRVSRCSDGESLFFYIRERFEKGSQGKIIDLRAELKDAENYSSQQAANIRTMQAKIEELQFELDASCEAITDARKAAGCTEHENVREALDRHSGPDLDLANKVLEARGERIDMLEERLKAHAAETVKCNDDIAELEDLNRTMRRTLDIWERGHIPSTTHPDQPQSDGEAKDKAGAKAVCPRSEIIEVLARSLPDNDTLRGLLDQIRQLKRDLSRERNKNSAAMAALKGEVE